MVDESVEAHYRLGLERERLFADGAPRLADPDFLALALRDLADGQRSPSAVSATSASQSGPSTARTSSWQGRA